MTLPAILGSFEPRCGASEYDIHSAETQLGRRLPQDYRDFLLYSDGLEGFIREEFYVMFWASAELVSLNEGYSVSEFIPGVTLVGTDGGDTGYGFRADRRQLEYVAVPLIGMSPNAITVMGDSFVELLNHIALGDHLCHG